MAGPPRDFVNGEFLEGAVDGPAVAHYAQAVAVNLKVAIGGRSLREVGRAAGLDHTTISAVLAGDRWPDLVTIAKLEQSLEARLWPDLVD